VQDGVYDAFTKRLAETAGAMKVADGFEPGAVIGPLIDMKAVEKVEAHIADAVKKGAKVVTGGKRAAQGGSFFEPTVLTDVTTDMVITKEETFGPVAPLSRFKTEADAIKMANDTPTLTLPRSRGREGRGPPPISTAATSAALACRRGARIRHRRHQRGHHLAQRPAGEIAPFGGMKESGIGREGSKYGIEEFLEVKYLCMGGIDR
jgi:succinate-semialdehyde dehydrogenase/glutarate-semialdehyde dehydrogenase